MGGSPILLFIALQSVGLARGPSAVDLSRWIVYPGLFSVPLTTAYAVLVDRALDVRLIVRRAIQYALARYTLLAAASVPFLFLVLFVYRNRSLPVASLFAGPRALMLLSLMTAALLVLGARSRIAVGLDRRFFRERYDARRILGSLVEEAREADDVGTLARALGRQIERALHPLFVRLLYRAPGHAWFVSPAEDARPLSSEDRK